MALVVTINGSRFKALATIAAGTPILLASGPEPVKADRVKIQVLGATGGGRALVYNDVLPGTVATDVATLCGPPEQLTKAADANTPGGMYTETAEPNGFIDLRTFAVDGAHTADTLMVDAHLKI